MLDRQRIPLTRLEFGNIRNDSWLCYEFAGVMVEKYHWEAAIHSLKEDGVHDSLTTQQHSLYETLEHLLRSEAFQAGLFFAGRVALFSFKQFS